MHLIRKRQLNPDKSKPFSHLVTGIVLRPFSLIADYEEKVKDAGILLAGRVFSKDKYSDRKGVYWTKITYPYHWTDILSTIDTLTLLGIKNHPKIDEIKTMVQKTKRWNI